MLAKLLRLSGSGEGAGCASLTPGCVLLNIFPGAKILLGPWAFVLPPAFLSATLTMICNMQA